MCRKGPSLLAIYLVGSTGSKLAGRARSHKLRWLESSSVKILDLLCIVIRLESPHVIHLRRT
jgi:hypothetical protein